MEVIWLQVHQRLGTSNEAAVAAARIKESEILDLLKSTLIRIILPELFSILCETVCPGVGSRAGLVNWMLCLRAHFLHSP